MKAPSKRDRQEFAGFCKNATDAQLPNIYAKEKKANRRVYAGIAQREMDRRQLPDVDLNDLNGDE